MALLGSVRCSLLVIHSTLLDKLVMAFSCGFPLAPELRAEWAEARSLEDCNEVRQLDRWWAIGGLGAIDRALAAAQQSNVDARTPTSKKKCKLSHELFWGGIPHEMRKGSESRVFTSLVSILTEVVS